MYIPPPFEETRPDVLHAVIARHPLGVLVTNGAGGLDANHLVFELDPRQGAHGVLRTHVARANPVWQQIASGDEMLVVFRAADAYISPNWYPTKYETHKEVPTWNYVVVHAHGRAQIRDDVRYLRGLVGHLVKTQEASQPVPWKMADSPQAFIDEELKAIVGIDVEVTRLIGKAKLGQNRELRDVHGAAAGLRAKGPNAIADAMLEYAARRGSSDEDR